MSEKQGRIVSIGKQSFKKLRERKLFYIDKTSFIREWWESEDDITLIARPRRFGKTLNIRMLESFFSVEYKDRADLFEGLEIWKHEKYHKLQGAIPVISLTFSSMKNATFQGFLTRIKDVIVAEYKSKKYLLEGDVLDEGERKYFLSINDAMVNNFMTQEIVETSISKLCTWLKRYHGISPIVLLDEYDAPMQEAWAHGYWDEMCTFMRSFMNETFKANHAISRGLLTGVTVVSKESIFSGLNNINVVTTMSNEYETCFGFTEGEVFAALDEMGMNDRCQEVKMWYDGFRFGKVEGIYNPWSVTCYLKKQQVGLYWANTASTDLIDELTKEGDKNLKDDMLCLLKGEAIEVSYDDQTDFRHLSATSDSVWNLLLATGYLKIVKDPANLGKVGPGRTRCLMQLNNLETHELFETLVHGWFNDRNVSVQYNEFVRCLLNTDIKGMQRFLNEVSLYSFSFFDVGGKNGTRQNESEMAAPERFYHGFVLGLLVELKGRYELTSNRESGFGRYDVMLKPLNDTDPAYVLEFKALDKEFDEKTLEDTLQAAKDQIKERNYAASLETAGIERDRIHQLGIAFQGKKCIVG